MAGDRSPEPLSEAVHRRLRMGRLLPLGDAADGAWLAEDAAAAVLRAAAEQAVPAAQLGRLRLSLAGTGEHGPPAVPPPPTALPHAPLRLDADVAAPPATPLPAVCDALRSALLAAADEQLGLRVATAELHVTELLDTSAYGAGPYAGDRHTGTEAEPEHRSRAEPEAEREPPPAPADAPSGLATAEAVLAVPGVTRLAPVLGPGVPGRGTPAVAVHRTGTGGEARGGRHLQIQLAVAADARPLDVARAVRRAAAKAAVWDAGEAADSGGIGPVTVAVLVTAVDRPAGQDARRG